MRSKLGILSGLILSLGIAGSVFAEAGKTFLKGAKAGASVELAKVKSPKPKKHRKHHRGYGQLKSKRIMKKTATIPPVK